jgi:hypothetical protein
MKAWRSGRTERSCGALERRILQISSRMFLFLSSGILVHEDVECFANREEDPVSTPSDT